MSAPIQLKTRRAGFGGLLVAGFHFERAGKLVELNEALRHGFVVDQADAEQIVAIIGNFTTAVSTTLAQYGIPTNAGTSIPNRDSFAA